EAIFSALDARGVIRGARVLDLYAGSGALGLEAASRGAASVMLVERGTAASKVCRSNAALIRRSAPRGHDLEIAVSGQSAQSFLDAATQPWDIVFLDPPYDLGNDELLRNLESLLP